MSVRGQLRRLAQTEHSSLKTREQSLQLIKSSDYSAYADLEADGKGGVGVEAFHLIQEAGKGVEHPIIYYAEIWPYKVEGQNETNCLLLAWRYDVDGNLTNNGLVTLFAHMSYRAVRQKFRSGKNKLGKTWVWYAGETYADAENFEENEV